MKHVLILAVSDHADTPYDAWAAEAGVVPHLLVAAERAPGYAGMAHVETFNNYRESGLIEKRALEIAREIPILAIIARGEVDILRAARLRAVLGIPGQLPDSALAYRDKLVMKEHFIRARVKVADYAAVDAATDVLQFVARYGYPIVVKPARGSGSLNTHLIHDGQELDDVLLKGFRERYLVERFVLGDMYHVDGLIVDGVVAAIHPSKYFHDCLCFQRGEFLGSYPLAGDHPLHDHLTNFAREMIAALPSPECMTFHAEIFHTPDDDLVACEIASRTSGGRTNQMLAATFRINLDRTWFLTQCGVSLTRATMHDVRPSGETTHYGQVLIYPHVGTLAALPEGPRPAWVEHESLAGMIGQHYQGGMKSGDVVAGYVVRGESVDELLGRFNDIVSWFEGRVHWSE